MVTGCTKSLDGPDYLRMLQVDDDCAEKTPFPKIALLIEH